MNDDIQTARAELLDSMITGEGISPAPTDKTDKTKHNSLMPKQALSVSPSMLAQAVAIKSLAAKYATVMGFFTKHTLSGAYCVTSTFEPGRTRQPAEVGLLSFRNGNITGEMHQTDGGAKRASSTGLIHAAIQLSPECLQMHPLIPMQIEGLQEVYPMIISSFMLLNLMLGMPLLTFHNNWRLSERRMPYLR